MKHDRQITDLLVVLKNSTRCRELAILRSKNFARLINVVLNAARKDNRKFKEARSHFSALLYDKAQIQAGEVSFFHPAIG